MPDRMAGLVFWNCSVRAEAESGVAELRIRSGIEGIAVVRVYHVARSAATRAIIAWMIVCAQVREHGVEEPGLLQAKKDGIGSEQGAESARAQQILCRLAWQFLRDGKADFGDLASSAFERAEDVAHLADLPSRKRIEIRQHALLFRLIG